MAENGQSEQDLADIRQYCETASHDSLLRSQVLLLRRLTVKTRQVEKADRFMEGRQGSLASLPAEVERHYHALQEQLRQARLPAASKDAEAAAQAEWQRARRVAVWQAFSQGCLSGLCWLACLPCRL